MNIFPHSIVRRLFLYILLTVLVLGVLISLIWSYAAYKVELKNTTIQAEQVHESFVPSISSIIWRKDYNLLRLQLESIMKFDFIERVEAVDLNGKLFFSGSPSPDSLNKHNHPLTILKDGMEIKVGDMNIYTDDKIIKSELLRDQLLYYLIYLLISLFAAFILTCIFHMAAGKYLGMITDELKNDSVDKFDEPIRIERRKDFDDELHYLVSTINNFRQRIKMQMDSQNLLLREVHHRIKNNMLMVSSVLHLQENRADPAAEAVLKEARSRVQSMTVLYDKLYRSDKLHRMSASDYFPGLINEILSIYKSETEIVLDLDIESMMIPVDTIFPVGIILNEMVTNTIKHAFAGKGSGNISIRFSRINDNEIEIIYSDNGKGLPDDIISGSNSGLGMMLIRRLTEQLEGSIFISNNNGANFIIRFIQTEQNS